MAIERNILIGGEAGQGLVTVGQLLSKALVRSGYEILVAQSYHSRIRGGHNTFSIRTGVEKLYSPQNKIDILVALNDESVGLHRQDLAGKGLLVVDAESPVTGDNCLRVPYKQFAKVRLFNTVALGVLGALLGLDRSTLERGIKDLIGAKHPEALEENNKTLDASYAWAMSNTPVFFAGLDNVSQAHEKIMTNGNEAIALGALAGGLKFCSFYPMTPSTSIALTIISHADAMGCVVEQAEDEIAAINMAIGASFAGAPSIVTTSGGGFALMTEGISLAGMTETPVVVAVSQRPGPATGLPTRTEQGDLEFVLHGGHGEFARAIFAPGSVESCFQLAQKAVSLADMYQTPVFILTDQYLADSYRAVEPFPFDDSFSAGHGCDMGMDKAETPYNRYAFTKSGVSPRLLPGASKHLVVADSDEHTGDGHITEDLDVRISMVNKRLQKMEGLRSAAIPPLLQGGQNADLLLITWGSSIGAVTEAAMELRIGGLDVATLFFEQVWPLRLEGLGTIFKTAKKIVCVEGNATGQFAKLLKREGCIEVDELILRYDGLPVTGEYVLEQFSTTA